MPEIRLTHARQHAVDSAGDHSVAGLAGVLKIGAGQMVGGAAHGDLGGIGANDHHSQAHVLSGADHTDSGLTAGQVLRAAGAAAFGWAQLGHGDLGGVSADQHHAQSHVLSGGEHTETGLTSGHVLTATGATSFAWQAPAAGGASTALSNLASVAINTTLVSDTDNTDDLGTAAIRWRTGYLATSLVCPVIKPAADGTSAIKLTKADGTTALITLDTTNKGISFSGAAQVAFKFTHIITTDMPSNVITINQGSIVSLTANSAGQLSCVNGIAFLNQAGYNATNPLAVTGLTFAVQVGGSSGTVAGVAGLLIRVQETGGGTLTNGYGLYVDAATKLGTFTNYYGIDVQAATQPSNIYGISSRIAAAANRWNLYIQGTAINYLAGNLLIGTTTDGMTAGGSLAIAKDLAHRGTKVGFYNTAPIAKVAAMTAQLTALTYTAPGTPDYALQDVTQSAPWGFADAEEARTLIAVVANLQTRLGEVESKLQAYGLFA